MLMRYIDGLLYFDFMFQKHKLLNTLFFTIILFLRISKLKLKEYFHAILEILVLWANINIRKVRASPKLLFNQSLMILLYEIL